MSTQPIQLFEGTELSLDLTVEDELELPLDLTGAKIVFTSKDTNKELKLTKTITETSDPAVDGIITNAIEGKYSVFFSAEDTSEIYSGTYFLRFYPVDGQNGNFSISGEPCEKAKFAICDEG